MRWKERKVIVGHFIFVEVIDLDLTMVSTHEIKKLSVRPRPNFYLRLKMYV